LPYSRQFVECASQHIQHCSQLTSRPQRHQQNQEQTFSKLVPVLQKQIQVSYQQM